MNKCFGLQIIFEFVDGPYGGGNQFLKALAACLDSRGALARSPKDATAFLCNSHHEYARMNKLHHRYPGMPVVQRVDGPISLITNVDDPREKQVHQIANLADGFIFQSRFSFDANIEFGFPLRGKPYMIVHNAPDSAIFPTTPVRLSTEQDTKLRIVATSWSGNPQKGFDVYEWLDNNLDFDKYEMCFIGNTPVKFKNISLIPPVDSSSLSRLLKEYHIYITASLNDPCSNALIEAIHCGLVPVARNSGGHPELVGNPRLLFNKPEEIPRILALFEGGGVQYSSSLPDIERVTTQYVDFIGSVLPSYVPTGCLQRLRSYFPF
ncbi:glycosyltransferase [Desulfomicrobium baculatum]|uniref:Glycosyl transferase, group 1 n=1 Tax=Desulfomicrobium baculatum (strain DSM 4028 / VKM B-1378 / X) TaxID=525897 RepID=C7LP36_DESBD|nr:glycosyltransferase [Desulfomicrobium baculatum]ACU91352.1 glycosyl transferase, group 1 [Desulfomicrobium baculatum DSM 4028]